PGLRDHATRARGVVHRDGLDPKRGEELLALGGRLPVRTRAPDVREPRTWDPEQRVIDPDENLAHHPEQRRVLEEVVGLVDRARLGVLEWDHAEGRLAAGHPREDEADG